MNKKIELGQFFTKKEVWLKKRIEFFCKWKWIFIIN